MVKYRWEPAVPGPRDPEALGPVPKFEVGVYNRLVSEAVAVGEHHRHFPDSWAETHYIEVEAEDAKAARLKIEVQHSEKNGFVIVSVEPKRDDAI